MDAQRVRRELEAARLRTRKLRAAASDLKATFESLLGDLRDLRAISADNLATVHLTLMAVPNKTAQELRELTVEELARVLIRRLTHRRAKIVLWRSIYRVHEADGARIFAGDLTVSVDDVDVPLDLRPDAGEAVLLASVRQWINSHG